MSNRVIESPMNYHLTRQIAEGGMGIVYEALQDGVDTFRKQVAIKVIREEYSAIPEFRANFSGEARLVANLIHTNIVQTYHLGETDGRYYMVMEYVNGINLEELIFQHRALGREMPIEMAVFIVSRVCRGLAYAHAKRDDSGQLLGLVHRDVNPRNIMLSFEGDVKLTDFGIAKALNLMYNKEGEVIAGKTEYLSPEQALKQVTDARADLFSLGIVLAEMILDRNPFDDDRPETVRKNILQMPLPDFRKERKGVDKRLAQILQKSLERDRKKRYSSAQEMLVALEVFLYSDGYGPTSEKLADYMKELFADGRAFTTQLAGDRTSSETIIT